MTGVAKRSDGTVSLFAVVFQGVWSFDGLRAPKIAPADQRVAPKPISALQALR
ncbi:MAG: hypothetical protein JWP78_3502 [Mucilaginibacter sp.]|nr:hypothetical protein [Mucilaginibacter sp.]